MGSTDPGHDPATDPADPTRPGKACTSLRQKLRPYLPNRSDRLALVSLSDAEPFRAYWPLVLTQIVGGKTWSISLVRHTTPRPVLTEVLLLSRATESRPDRESISD